MNIVKNISIAFVFLFVSMLCAEKFKEPIEGFVCDDKYWNKIPNDLGIYNPNGPLFIPVTIIGTPDKKVKRNINNKIQEDEPGNFLIVTIVSQKEAENKVYGQTCADGWNSYWKTILSNYWDGVLFQRRLDKLHLVSWRL